jgi:hypothetical protein
MTAGLDHTIVPVTDKWASAEFLGGILALPPAPPWGPFVPLRLGNGVSLDFMDAVDFDERHCAFLVDESTSTPCWSGSRPAAWASTPTPSAASRAR